MASDVEPSGGRTVFAEMTAGRWGLVVAACLVALLALGPVYDTNDDPAMVGLLAGAAGQAPVVPPFLGLPVAAALRRLYAAAPAVPWYGLAMEACGLLSAGLWAALIGSCLVRPASRIAATAGLLVGAGYLVLRVNFMAEAFSLFLAATAWLWKLQLERAELRRRQAWIGAAMGLAYLVRPSLQWLLLYFALPCLLVSTRGRARRRLLLIGAAAGALVLAGVAAEYASHDRAKTAARAAFDGARSLLVDIPREPTPTALAAAGWSRGDYDMALLFGMYDEELYSVERIRAFVGSAGRASWLRGRARASREYLTSRFHLLCLAALLAVLWVLRADRAGAARHPSAGARAAAWAWVGAGILALVVTRFPPRAFVPLYLYVGALAVLLPPRAPGIGASRPASGPARAAALAAVLSVAALAVAFWAVDARAGRARLMADERALAAAADAAGPGTILVPVGPVLETRYTAVLAPRAPGVLSRMPPGGWLVATPALDSFLAKNGFASGRDFMRALTSDPRVLFVVRSSRRGDAAWLIERLEERYAPGARLEAVPAGADGQLQFFRLRGAAALARTGMVESRRTSGIAPAS